MKKKFLSFLLLASLISTSVSIFAADNTILNQKFVYDANDTSIGTPGTTNKYNVHAMSITNGDINISQSNETDGVLKISYPGSANDNTAKVGIRKQGVFNSNLGTVVIKTRMKFSQQNDKTIALYFAGTSLGTTAAQTYTLARLRFDNTQYQLGSNPAPVVKDTDLKLASSAWHDFTFVLEENGELVDGKSQDKIYAYIDNKLFYNQPFADGHNFTGKIDELNYNLTKGKNSAAGSWEIDSISTSTYNGGTATVETKEVTEGDIFEHTPTITPTNVNYDLSVGGYNVVIPDGSPLKYNNETKQFEATEVSTPTEVTVKYDFIDVLIPDQSVVITVKKNAGQILPTQIDQEIFSSDITLNVGQSFALNNLFKVAPALSTNKELEFVNIENNSAFEITNGNITAIAKGNGQLKVTAKGDTTVTKTVNVIVNDGNFDDVNNIETTDIWAADGAEAKGFKALGYSGKTFSPISVISDPLMGNAFKFSGVGGKNGGGSHLDKWLPATSLTANKDYKLSGWVKMDINGAKESAARIDLKLFGYYMSGQDFMYPSDYQISIQMSRATVENQGWVFFETDALNLDVNRAGNNLEGFKLEIASYNNEAGIDSYVSNLAFVEQDTVKVNKYSLQVDGQTLTDGQEISKNINSTFTIGQVCVPSSGVAKLTFSSSDETLATVDANGLVTIKGSQGQVTFTVTDGTTQKTVVVNIVDPLTDIAVSENNISMTIADGDKELIITKTPETSHEGIAALTSNDQVCTVTIVNGKLVIHVTGIGSATVSVKSIANDAIKFDIVVNVTDVAATNIEVKKAEAVVENTLDVALGDKFTFTFKVSPISRVDKNVSVSLSASDILSYNEDTKEFTVLKSGSVTITFSCGDFSKTLVVNVSGPQITVDDKLTVEVGKTIQVEATVNPASMQGLLQYSSSDQTIATVSESGLITAIKSGTVKITVSIDGTSKEITVTIILKATSITVKEDKVSIKVGANYSIEATVNPVGYTSAIKYVSSDTNILTVDASGKVTAIAKGEATITVSIDGVSQVITFNVANKVNIMVIVLPCIAAVVILGGVALFLLKRKK